MKNRSIIPFVLLFFVLIAGFITFGSNKKATTTPCKESMECCKKKLPCSTPDPIFETLSRQFGSISPKVN